MRGGGLGLICRWDYLRNFMVFARKASWKPICLIPYSCFPIALKLTFEWIRSKYWCIYVNQMHLMNAFKWINEREFLFFTRIIFIIWIIEVTKKVHHFLLVCALCYYFLNIFAIEFIQEFKCFENWLVRLGGLKNMTCFLTINV